MEINSNNAFLMGVKVSFEIWQSYICFNNLSNRFKEELHKFIVYLLKKPLFTTMCLSIITGVVTVTVFFSMLIFSISFIIVALILLIEGFTIFLIISIGVHILLFFFIATIFILGFRKMIRELRIM